MFQTDHPISLTNAEKNFKLSAFGSWQLFTSLSYNVIHEVFVLFTFA